MSNTEKPIVLITGSTGYIGGYVLHQLLEAGYTVRATARPAKADALKELHKDKVEVFIIPDLIGADYTEALKGVGAVIHVASPLPYKEEPAKLIRGTIDGTKEIIRQAVASGVKRIIVTGSVSAMFDSSTDDPFYKDIVITDQDWNPSKADMNITGGLVEYKIYCAAKAAQDRAVWKLESEYPEVDFTVIHPPFVYGPLAPGVKIAKGDRGSLATIHYFWREVVPEGGSSVVIDRVPQEVPPAITVDVRDVARAHIAALTAPLASEVGRKRLIVAGPSISWVDAVAHLRKVMPELKDRLASLAEGAAEKEPLKIMTFDIGKARDLLGLHEYIDWRKTVEDTMKCILEVERSWRV